MLLAEGVADAEISVQTDNVFAANCGQTTQYVSIMPGDVITKINGIEMGQLKGQYGPETIFYRMRAGDEVQIEFLRQDDQYRQACKVCVKLQDSLCWMNIDSGDAPSLLQFAANFVPSLDLAFFAESLARRDIAQKVAVHADKYGQTMPTVFSALVSSQDPVPYLPAIQFSFGVNANVPVNPACFDSFVIDLLGSIFSGTVTAAQTRAMNMME